MDGTLIESAASIKSFRRRDEEQQPPDDDPGNPSVDFRGERRRLEQENPLRPALVDHVVDVRVLGIDPANVGTIALSLLHEIEGLLYLVEHRQGEDVDF